MHRRTILRYNDYWRMFEIIVIYSYTTRRRRAMAKEMSVVLSCAPQYDHPIYIPDHG